MRYSCVRTSLLGIALTFSLLFATSASAETVSQKMPNGKTALARFYAGDQSKPAVIMIHGFLTTNNFNTILSATEMLKDNQVTVLAPTLTLGINKRKGGLPCDAIHTHSIAESLQEIEQWVRWLDERGQHNIILSGHSQGSISILAYGANKPHPSVKRIIAASLAYLDAFTPMAHQTKQMTHARQLIAAGNSNPAPFSLAYCQGNFNAPAQVYLDYMQWDKKKLIDTINNISLPVDIIMGGAGATSAAGQAGGAYGGLLSSSLIGE